MSGKKRDKRHSPALAFVLALAAVVLYMATKPPVNPPTPPPEAPDAPPLADLGTLPDWSLLSQYDGTITAPELETLLTEVFSIDDTWRDYLTLTPQTASIRTSLRNPEEKLHLTLAAENQKATPPRYWRPVSEMAPAPTTKPLDGVRIALDPGHIGGDYAQLEERWFQIDEGNPVMEGEMALAVAKLVKPQLEALGATVTLVRDSTNPLTPLRHQDFLTHASEKLRTGSPEEIRNLSERLFYRTAEIRERARLVNETIQPDLVICIHFNAEPWGDPSSPQLTAVNHCHLLLNGAYTPSELAHDDERFEMLLKLLQGTHAEEAALAVSTAAAFDEVTALPPYRYKPDSSRALNINKNPYLWARNLLANRLYRCPVVFLEPYVMNSHEVYQRVQEGDYEGTRLIAGKERISLFREYAQAITKGLTDYYREERTEGGSGRSEVGDRKSDSP